MVRKSPRGAIVPFLIAVALAACGDSAETTRIPFGLETQVVATAPRVSEIVFAPDGRVFFAEQITGNVRVISADGQLQEEPFAHLEVAFYLEQLDWGLTGLALDPEFETNRYVYALYMEPVSVEPPPDGPVGRPVVVRFTDKDGRGTEKTIITDDFPETPKEHPGYNGAGNLHFGPDGFLYVSIGDFDYAPAESVARDRSSPVGKLLRIDPETGQAPPGNPPAEGEGDPRVFASGFREPFDFAFHPETGAIYGTDNTTVSCEELNVIEAGKDYGWPDVGEFPYSDCAAGGGEQAVYHLSREGKQPGEFLSFVEVSGLAFVPPTQYPQMGDGLLVCESQRSEVEGQRSPGVLRRLVLGGAAGREVTASDVIVRDCRGAVAVSPDGFAYYANETEIRKLVMGQSGGGPPALSPP